MPISPGTRLGPYAVVAPLGAGGMGEVYRATDTRLGREVAIKVLPRDVARDPDRLARFEREARLLASLNHPNIAAIYGIEHTDGLPFLAMELVEGEDLAARLARGPVPLDEALPIARQIAQALEAAHDKGIVHRDLKPANVKVTPDGTVKVLDFGLAKPLRPDGSGAIGDPLHSATLTSPAMTAMGVVLGTAAYMAPEQARARPIDKRADIWAFGVVLFEMLSGERAFAGDTLTDVLAAVVHKDPPWDCLPPTLPPVVRRLTRRCLAKNADERLHDIADARLEIEEALRPATESIIGSPATGEPEPRSRRRAWHRAALAGGVALATLAGILIGRTSLPPPEPAGAEPVRRLSITGVGWDETDITEVVAAQNLLALSPDGSRLVYSAVREGTRRLFLRELDAFDAEPIKGTDHGSGPFFSPDGRSVAFVADGRLKKVALSGGLPQAFGTAPGLGGGVWGADDSIFYSPMEGAGLWKTSVSGARPVALVQPDTAAGEVGRGLPQLLPGTGWLLFTASMGGRASRVGVYRPETGESRILLEDANNAHYLPPDLLVYGRDTEIWASRFDAARAELVGAPRRMLERVWAGGFPFSTLFTVSQQGGVLIYASTVQGSGRRSLVWVDREGHETAITRDARAYAAPRISPDGTSILVRIAEETTDIWRYEIARGVLARLTSDTYVDGPLWSADGKDLIYTSNRSGVPALYRRPVTGEGEPIRVGEAGRGQYTDTLSADGRTIVAMEMSPTGGGDLYLVPFNGEAPPVPLLVSGSSDYLGSLSPDGKWFVYASRASGRAEVFVRRGAGGRRREAGVGGRRHRTALVARGWRDLLPGRTEDDGRTGAHRSRPRDLRAPDAVHGAVRGARWPVQLRRDPRWPPVPHGQDAGPGGADGVEGRHRLGSRSAERALGCTVRPLGRASTPMRR
jgi:eukaryotic-like serine/threonine-protein kinase